MKKRNIILISGAMLLSLTLGSLFSCNSGDNVEDETHVKVIFHHTFGDTNQENIQRQINKFKKIIKETDGVEIIMDDLDSTYQGGYSDISAKIQKTFATGNEPTVAVAYPDHVANYKALENGEDGKYVVKLDDLINDSEIGIDKESELEGLTDGPRGMDDFVESFIDEGRHYIDEGTYSFPFMKSTEIMMYDYNNVTKLITDYTNNNFTNTEDYLASLNWNQFMDVCKYASNKFTAANYDGSYGNNLSAALAYDSDSNLFITQCYQRNIPFISMNNKKGQIDFNNQQAKDLVTEFKNLYESKTLLTKGTNDGKYSSDLFKARGCLFTVGSTGGAGYNDATATGGFKIGICKVPTYDNSERAKYVSQGVTLCLLNNTGVSSEINARRVKYGWKLIKFLTSTDVCAEITLGSNGYVPVRYSSYKNEDYEYYLKNTGNDFMPEMTKVVINDINGNTFNYPVFKGTETVRTQVGGIVTQTLLGTQSLDDAFDSAYRVSYAAL